MKSYRRSGPLSEPTTVRVDGSSEEDLRDLYDHAPCGYLSILPDGRIAKVNVTFADWTEHAPSELVGEPFHQVLSMASRMFYETHFAPLLRMQGFFNEVALDILSASGNRIPMLANALERRDGDGRVIVTRIAMFRAQERRRHERGLHDAHKKSEEANQVLSRSLADERFVGELREQFIAVLGHDLRNPLAAIDGGTRLLLKENLSERATIVVDLMRGSVVRMSTLIDNVLDFARGRLGGGIGLQKAVGDLTPVLEQVVAELRVGMPDRAIHVDLRLSTPVNFDAQRIAQLVSNLVSNALTHGAADAPVTVQAHSSADGGFEISVANAGVAISGAAREQLFQPFFRGEARQSRHGLGLGLHIASEIAKAHNGALTVSSDDVVTRFTLKVDGK